MIRGREDGIREEVLEGAPLDSVVEVAVTITESDDIAVLVFVAVGLMVCGAVVVTSLLVGTTMLEVPSVSDEVGVPVAETEALDDGSVRASLAVVLAALLPGAVPEELVAVFVSVGGLETVALPSVFVGTVFVLLLVGTAVMVGVTVSVLMLLLSVGVAVLVVASVGMAVFVLELVGPAVLVSVPVGSAVFVFVLVSIEFWVLVFVGL